MLASVFEQYVTGRCAARRADLLGVMCDSFVFSSDLLRYAISVLAVDPPSIHQQRLPAHPTYAHRLKLSASTSTLLMVMHTQLSVSAGLTRR